MHLFVLRSTETPRGLFGALGYGALSCNEHCFCFVRVPCMQLGSFRNLSFQGVVPQKGGLKHCHSKVCSKHCSFFVFLSFQVNSCISMQTFHSSSAPLALRWACMCSRENPGTVHVVATFPAYQSLYQNLATFGCTVDYWQPRYNHEDSSWAFHLEDLQKVIKVYFELTADFSVNMLGVPCFRPTINTTTLTATHPSERRFTPIMAMCLSV